MISVFRYASCVAVLVPLSTCALLAADAGDPNKFSRTSSANKTYQQIQAPARIQSDPLKQYEDAMRPIHDLAIRETTAGLIKDSKNASLYARRAAAHAAKKDYKSALPDLDNALKLDPNQAPLYSKRAVMHYMLKNYDKSWKDVREAEKRGASLPGPFLEALKKTTGRKQ